MMSSATSGFRVLFCTRLPEVLTGSTGTRLPVHTPNSNPGFTYRNLVFTYRNLVFTYRNLVFTYRNRVFTYRNPLFAARNPVVSNSQRFYTD